MYVTSSFVAYFCSGCSTVGSGAEKDIFWHTVFKKVPHLYTSQNFDVCPQLCVLNDLDFSLTFLSVLNFSVLSTVRVA